MDIPQPMIVMEARPTFVRVPQTGDELALWRQQSGLSLAFRSAPLHEGRQERVGGNPVRGKFRSAPLHEGRPSIV